MLILKKHLRRFCSLRCFFVILQTINNIAYMIAPSHGMFEIPLAKNHSKFYVIRYNSEIENWEVLPTPTFYDKDECAAYVVSLNEKYGKVDIKD